MSSNPYYHQFLKYVPEKAAEICADWLVHYRVKLTVTNDRKSKLGDYRAPHGKMGHRISVNGTLSPYGFLVTYTHEMAHLMTWEKYKNTVAPHGAEWKEIYKTLMLPFLAKDIFPPDIQNALITHFSNPTASSCTDKELYKVLHLDEAKNLAEQKNNLQFVTVEQLPIGAIFSIKGEIRKFKKVSKMRKNYLCEDMNTQRMYRVNPLALCVVHQ
jgi:hypothetical protein